MIPQDKTMMITCKCGTSFKAENLEVHRKKCIGDISKVYYE